MLTQFLGALAPVLGNDFILGSLLTFLVACAVIPGLRLRRAVARITQALTAACNHLGAEADPIAFAASYEAVSTELAGDRILGSSWSCYRQTLLVPRAPNRRIMATESPKRWFDLASLLRRAGTDCRYHAALPGLLVGAGLLVTFSASPPR